MRRSAHFDFERSPLKKIDAYLINTYDLSLFDFLRHTADIVQYHNADYSLHRISINNRIQNKLRKLRVNIIKTINEYLDFISSTKRHVSELPPYISNKWGITKLFEYLDLIKGTLVDLKKAYPARHGRRLKLRSKIVSAWGFLIKEKQRNIRWSDITGLYDWLWQRLENHDFYKTLKPPDDLQNFNIQYHRHQTVYRAKYKELYTFGETNPWGLVIFGKKFAHADFYISSIIEFGERHPKPEYLTRLKLILDGKVEPKDIHEERDAFTFLATMICFRKRKLVPLIIFPDFSYYVSPWVAARKPRLKIPARTRAA